MQQGEADEEVAALSCVAVGGALLASAVAGVGWGPSPWRLSSLRLRCWCSRGTAGFRHDSIPNGVAAIEALGERFGFEVDNTEDPGVFTDANLAQYDAVVFLHTTGNVLPTACQP